MKKIVIFSGTSEGRELSELLTKEKMHHTVCVATGYGAEMMEESPYARVVIGRMDADGMKSFLRNEVSDKKSKNCDGIIIDATHPYASEATVNIRAAAKLTGVSYVRISRTAVRGLPAGTGIYSDIEECARFIDGTTGNILLTTGSKELSGYCKAISKETKARTFVRILPTEESLKLCRDQGIGADHIIAMQGPFCRELNEAMIRQYDIRHLITKESGEAGGFKEKMDAALSAGVSLHVIARPSDEDGVSVEEAFFLVTGKKTASFPETEDPEQKDPEQKDPEQKDPEQKDPEQKNPEQKDPEEIRSSLDEGSSDGSETIRIALIGAGMGTEGSLTVDAREEIERSEAVFGAKRLINELPCPNRYAMYRPEDIIPVLEENDFRRVAIVFSGDTGFYSGAKAMAKALKEWRKDMELPIIPGISSYSCLASRLGESYDDALLLSLHGKNTERNVNTLAEMVRFNEKIFVLVSCAGDVGKIAESLALRGIKAEIFAGSNLSYPEESVIELTLEEASSFAVKGPVTVLIKNPDPERRSVYRSLKDSDLLRSEIPMTKEYVRHVSILKLGLKEGDLLYDIGGGTGSVAIEAALQDPGVDVYTFEKKSEAAELIRQNIKRSGTFNVTLIEGEAEEKLKTMPKPDCVFIGGSGGRLREIMEIICSKGKGIRFVINAVTIETLSESAKLAEEFGASGEETILLSVTDVQKTGDFHMLRGQNPIWIFSFTI